MTSLNNLHSNITDLLPNEAATILISIPQALTARGRRFWIYRLLITLHQKNISAVDVRVFCVTYEGWNFNSGNYLFTTDTK